MAMQGYTAVPPRIGKVKGEIFKHALPFELLQKEGRQVKFSKNNSDTYVARRWLPYGATSTSANTQNRFFQDGTGDRSAAMVQANQIAEGVTPPPDSLQAVDTTVVIQQYGILYGFTDKTYNLYEDNVAEEMGRQIGERMSLINEQICYGGLKQCTNQFYAVGTSIATVAGRITLNLVRQVTMGLQANHAGMVNTVLKASPLYGTDAVAAGYCVYGHTDLEPDIRDMAGFTPAERYSSGTPMAAEMGKAERFRFLTSPDLPSLQDAGAAIGATGCYSTTGSNIDVYQVVITGRDAWSQLSVRGLDAMKPVLMLPSDVSKADPLGQRGYYGVQWWKAILLENPGWMAILNVGRTAL